MPMSVIQVRLPKGLIKKLEKLVDKELYSSKSSVIREAIRKLILEKQIGPVHDLGDSEKEGKIKHNKRRPHFVG